MGVLPCGVLSYSLAKRFRRGSAPFAAPACAFVFHSSCAPVTPRTRLSRPQRTLSRAPSAIPGLRTHRHCILKEEQRAAARPGTTLPPPPPLPPLLR